MQSHSILPSVHARQDDIRALKPGIRYYVQELAQRMFFSHLHQRRHSGCIFLELLCATNSVPRSVFRRLFHSFLHSFCHSPIHSLSINGILPLELFNPIPGPNTVPCSNTFGLHGDGWALPNFIGAFPVPFILSFFRLFSYAFMLQFITIVCG